MRIKITFLADFRLALSLVVATVAKMRHGNINCGLVEWAYVFLILQGHGNDRSRDEIALGVSEGK